MRTAIRFVVVAGVIALASGVYAPTAMAANPNQSAVVTLSFDGSCHATVTFTWTGYSGNADQVQLAIVREEEPATSLFDLDPNPEPGRSGSYTHIFTTSSSASHTFAAHAFLNKPQGHAVALLASVDSTPPTVQPCDIVL